jgi:hypothetical protein
MLQTEIDRNPNLTNAELFRTVSNSLAGRAPQAEFREGVRLATRDGERVPQTMKRDEALDELNARAAELRKADPSLTPEQAFSKAYLDPRNRELAKAERSAARDAISA